MICRMGFLEYADILTPNQLEAEALAGLPVTGPGEAATAARRIRDLGIPKVIVTLGELGAYVESDEYSGHVPAFDTPVVASVAAGDAFQRRVGIRVVRRHAVARRGHIWFCRGGCQRLTTRVPGINGHQGRSRRSTDRQASVSGRPLNEGLPVWDLSTINRLNRVAPEITASAPVIAPSAPAIAPSAKMSFRARECHSERSRGIKAKGW